jgi:hypothetical protein
MDPATDPATDRGGATDWEATDPAATDWGGDRSGGDGSSDS